MMVHPDILVDALLQFINIDISLPLYCEYNVFVYMTMATKYEKIYHPGCSIYFSRLFESKLQPRSPSTHWATIL